MKRIFNLSLLAVFCLVGCDDDYIEQFNINEDYSKVDVASYVLTTADYGEIAKNKTNQALALSKDPEGKLYVEGLDAIGTNLCFANVEEAEEYLPAFLAGKFYDSDLGSKFTISYKVSRAKSAYMADFESVTDLMLTEADYEKVWEKHNITAHFLSPSTESAIPSLLADAVSGARSGDVVMLSYAYSPTEPSISNPMIPIAYDISYVMVDKFEEAGKYVIAAEVDGQYYTFGLLDEGKTYGYMKSDPVTPSEPGVLRDVEDYVLAVEGEGDALNLKNTLNQYIYQDETHDSFNVADAAPASGAAWKFVFGADGKCSIVNVDRGKHIKYDTKYGSFGSYAESKFATAEYYSNDMTSAEGFTTQVVSVGEGFPEGTDIVAFDSKYGYKATAYVKSVDYSSLVWTVSDEIDLTSAVSPEISMDIAARFFATSASEAFEVCVTDNYSGDATTTSWTKLNIENWSDGKNWNYINTGDIALNDFVGKKIRLGLKYTSSDKAATIEVKNVKIAQSQSGLTYKTPNLFKEVKVELGEGGMKAAVAANKTALYRFDGTSWTAYTSSAAKVNVVQPETYSQLGTSSIADVEAFAANYLNGVYPLVEEGDVVVLVVKTAKDNVSAVEFAKNGAVWETMKTFVVENSTFSLDSDGFSPKISVYADSPMTGGDNGGFTVQDVSMPGSFKYIWSSTSSYGWKATAFMSNTNFAAESWIISPSFNFGKAEDPYLTFDEAHKFVISGKEPAYHFSVKVTTKFTGDVTTTEWVDITDRVQTWAPGDSWDFANVGKLSLADFKGNKSVVIAFKYLSFEEGSPTFEVKNFKVAESSVE